MVSVIGVTTVLVWSIGFVVLIYMAIRRKSKQLRNFTTLRAFGYFYNGFELQYFWWELLVKRMDVLCCYGVTYTLAAYPSGDVITAELMHMEWRSAAVAPRECNIGHLRSRRNAKWHATIALFCAQM